MEVQGAKANVCFKDQESVEILLLEEKQFSTKKLGTFHIPAVRNAEGALYLSHSIDYLKQQNVINQACGYLYEDKSSSFIWIGIDPLTSRLTVPLESSYPTLVLKLRPQFDRFSKVAKIKTLVGLTIGQILQLIKDQTRLACSISDSKAAKQIGLDKKLLDEAKSQFTQAKKYGFNFQGHLKDNMAILKQYVTLCKKVEGLNDKQADIIDKMGKLFILIEKGSKLCKKQECCEKIETKFYSNPLVCVTEGFNRMSIELDF